MKKDSELRGLKLRADGEYTVITTDDILAERPKRVSIDKELRDWILQEADCICKNCIQYYPYLEIHHKDGDRSNSVVENLMAVCPNCHKLLDRDIRSIDDETETE